VRVDAACGDHHCAGRAGVIVADPL
jgi:hypothetical protein